MKQNYRSKFEQTFHKQNPQFGYESDKFKYTQPATLHTYTPDFRVNDKLFIETKGRLTASDRKKMIMVRDQHPGVLFIIVFQNWSNKLSKLSKTTYREWANKNGFLCYNNTLPDTYLNDVKSFKK